MSPMEKMEAAAQEWFPLTPGDLKTIARRVLADPEVEPSDARALAHRVLSLMELTAESDQLLDDILKRHRDELELRRQVIEDLCRRLGRYRRGLMSLLSAKPSPTRHLLTRMLNESE